MQLYTDTLGLSESAFTILRDLIHERTGLFFEDSKRDLLAQKLSARVIERGFESFLDYYYLLKYDTQAAEEWGPVMDALTVQETFFWREMDAVRALAQVLAPQWEATQRGKPLRIWSAACATGEEPLTIAIALHEAGWLDRMPIEIAASDASPAAIATAQRGLYRERALRNLPPEMRAKYFTQTTGGWRIAPEMHARVRWSIANITDAAAVAQRASAPVIFCRNVFLYFSPEGIRRAVCRFGEHMPAPGYLFVGVAESLLRLTTAFELQEIGGAFVYVK
jgi:chemotaxis protein methyltransferase CheR